MSYSASFNGYSGAAAQAASQTILAQMLPNVNMAATQTSHGINATQDIQRGQCAAASAQLSAGIEENSRTLAVIERAMHVAAGEIEQAAQAAGYADASDFARVPEMAGSEGELLVGVGTGALAKAGLGTAVTGVMKGAGNSDVIEAINGDQNLTCEERQAEIAGVLAASAQAEGQETANFGLIRQADAAETIPVSFAYDEIFEAHGVAAFEEMYNFDIANPSDAFPEVEALISANQYMEAQLSEVNVIEARFEPAQELEVAAVEAEAEAALDEDEMAYVSGGIVHEIELPGIRVQDGAGQMGFAALSEAERAEIMERAAREELERNQIAAARIDSEPSREFAAGMNSAA